MTVEWIREESSLEGGRPTYRAYGGGYSAWVHSAGSFGRVYWSAWIRDADGREIERSKYFASVASCKRYAERNYLDRNT